MSYRKVSREQQSTISHILIVFVSFLISVFIAYMIIEFTLYVGVKFGFLDGYSGIESSVLFFIAFFLLVINLFPNFLFAGWIIRYKTNQQTLESLPFVTIIIPAFNEQETINKSIQCAVGQNYPEFEVIVVDDGSSDFTPLLIDYPEVRTIHLSQNQGKANAVNKAIGLAKGEYILFSDADSHLHPDVVRHLLPHFNDTHVGAVTGQLIVRKSNKLIVIWQMLEYIFSQSIVKIAQHGSGSSISVLPGPISMYRRKLLLACGGFKDRTLVEDFDMTLEVIAAGYKTKYEPKAIAWTSTPKDFGALKRQRLRWYRGNIQVLKIYYKDIFFNRQYGMLGCFWLPYMLFWGFGGMLIYVALLLSFPLGIYFSYTPLQNIFFILMMIVLFEIISLMQYIFVLALDKNLRLSLVLASFIVKPYYIFLAFIYIVSMYREFTKKEIVWNG